jgi:hypothetical protein
MSGSKEEMVAQPLGKPVGVLLGVWLLFSSRYSALTSCHRLNGYLRQTLLVLPLALSLRYCYSGLSRKAYTGFRAAK